MSCCFSAAGVADPKTFASTPDIFGELSFHLCCTQRAGVLTPGVGFSALTCRAFAVLGSLCCTTARTLWCVHTKPLAELHVDLAWQAMPDHVLKALSYGGPTCLTRTYPSGWDVPVVLLSCSM